ncbi:hypothetical protein SVAN01_11800 [Stagonosporopsis vannaccii]|nr:hypothetical protein SVAN01_11800 [Stagonosporopsis vannaccii]
MAARPCQHVDVREFSDGLRSCLACGETRFREESRPDQAATEQCDYIYTDLRCLERGQTIRLVVLAPGNPGDPLHCTLVLSGLLHSHYDAVSYTWATEDGDDSKTHTVHIDGSVLKVTQNCHAALCQLRHPERHRRLWIDAICVNQFNVKERNHQVGIMDIIYRTASEVHLCITDRSYDYSTVMSWLSRASNRQSVPESAFSKLIELYRCRYFTRVWIIQEIVLAKAIVLHINYAQVALTNDMLNRFPASSDMPGALRARMFPQRYKSLFQQMRMSLQLSCSDPRDHIYGILSLLDPDVRALVPVDYNLSVTKLYINTFKVYIKTCRDLHVLAYAAAVLTPQSESATSSFTIDHFHDFLLQKDLLEQKAYGDSPINWSESVELLSEPDASHMPENSHPRVWTMQSSMTDQQILPAFKVNIYSDQFYQSSNSVGFNILEIRGEFDKPQNRARSRSDFPEWMHDIIPSALVNTNYGHKRAHKVLERLWKRKDYGSNIFGTGRGVGRSILPALPGDRVCDVDGMRTRLLIRHVDGCRYRIITACLWQPFDPNYEPPEFAELVELF